MKGTLAIPNGSLHEVTVELLAKSGIKLIPNGRRFIVELKGSDVFDRALIMRPQDMPEALFDGGVDAAITGYDCLCESGLENVLAIITKLEYSKKTRQPVRIVVLGKNDRLIDEDNILVTSEYPNLTKPIFKKSKIRFSHGGTEQKVAYGKYDYGVCVTETGESVVGNGLKIVKTILTSSTIFAAREVLPEYRYFGELLVGALRSERYRLLKINVMAKDLEGVLNILPALNAPTVSKLADGNFAVETVVEGDKAGNLIVLLKGIKVSGILVCPIDIVC